MKKLVFIDNDFEKYAQQDADRLKRTLHFSGMDLRQINSMKIISEFYKLKREEQYNIISNRNSIICTWSVYTQTHFNSLGQLVRLFEAVHRHEDKGLIYLDGSGQLKTTVSMYIKDTKANIYDFLCGMSKNTILSFDKEWKLVKLTLDFTEEYLFKEEHLSASVLSNLLV